MGPGRQAGAVLADPWHGRRGIDILADIVQHFEPANASALLKNLRTADPRIADELRQRLFIFDNLAQCDNRGIQKLLKLVTIRDLALSLKGAPEPVLEKLAENMSHHAIEDLQNEIRQLGKSRVSDIEQARAKIIGIARALVEKREMTVYKPNERLVE